MSFPDPSLIPPASRLSPTAGTVVIALAVVAAVVWAACLVVRFARAGADPVDKPGIGAIVAYVLALALTAFVVGDILLLRVAGRVGAGVVTEADGFTISSRTRGSSFARTTRYVFVRMRDEATGETCADTTTPAAVAALEGDSAMRLPFTYAAGFCQVGTEPSLSRSGAGMLGFAYLLGLMFAWPRKRGATSAPPAGVPA